MVFRAVFFLFMKFHFYIFVSALVFRLIMLDVGFYGWLFFFWLVGRAYNRGNMFQVFASCFLIGIVMCYFSCSVCFVWIDGFLSLIVLRISLLSVYLFFMNKVKCVCEVCFAVMDYFR